MTPFANAHDVDRYVGGVLRMAAIDPVVGPSLAGAAVTLGVTCTDISARIVVEFHHPIAVIITGEERTPPEVELICTSAFLDGFFRGERNLVDALASGEVGAKGRISKVLKVLPLLAQTFPFYRQLAAARDRATTVTASGAPS